MANSQQRDIYSVTRLNREVRSVLETGFPLIWLEGELSNLACPASGHWYFSLKDSHSQVRCAMFRTRNRLLRFTPRNGMQIMVRAKIGLYEPRGEFQILIEHMEEAGEGALRQQFEDLKNKLNQQGLFASSAKKELPKLAKRIGIITSATGAAVHDVLTTLKRRFPSQEVIIYPVSVQGKTAAKDISTTIQLADKRNECDILILTRGGGSLEDLWSFNEEMVAQAIYNCNIPIISAVGHDIDFTIADFVADVRAATPTAAAELVSPDLSHLQQQTANLFHRIKNIVINELNQKRSLIHHLSKRLTHPSDKIEQAYQRLDENYNRLIQSVHANIASKKFKLNELHTRCQTENPIHTIKSYQQKVSLLYQELKSNQITKMHFMEQRFTKCASTLHAVSPLATLSRGYAYVTSTKDGKLIQNTEQVNVGDTTNTKLSNGTITSTVNKILQDK